MHALEFLQRITHNVYGLFSINTETFNQSDYGKLECTKAHRDIVLTCMRVHNGVLNVLGYIPGISQVSGCVRIATGVIFGAVVLVLGSSDKDSGHLITGRWYREALRTAMMHIARGIFEACVPFGFVANAVLDIVATPIHFVENMETQPVVDGEKSRRHGDVAYPGPLKILRLI